MLTFTLSSAMILSCLAALSNHASAEGGPPRALSCSLKQAIQIALGPDGNRQLQLAQQSLRLAQSHSNESRSALFPDISAAVSGQRQLQSLETMGVSIPGLTIPRTAGPYNTVDARMTATSTLDLSSIQRWRAMRKGIKIAQGELSRMQDQVAAAVAKAYWTLLRAQALVQSAQESVKLGEALLEFADHRAAVGKGMMLDVTRARLRLVNERGRLLANEIQQSRARFKLLQAMGLSLDAPVELTDPLTFTPAQEMPLQEALATTFESRGDLQAQQDRVQSRRLLSASINSERLPSLLAFAHYGPQGLGFNRTVNTYAEGVALRLSLFDGARVASRLAASRAQLKEEETLSSDLRAQAELEIRESLESMRLAKKQVDIAQEGLSLAQEELAQAQRRYVAGITNNLEVIEAQTHLAHAQEKQTEALFAHQQARIDLGLAMGTIRTLLQ